MTDINNIQTLAQLNQEMLDALSRLEGAMKNKDNKQLIEIKGLILNLQRKTSELLS